MPSSALDTELHSPTVAYEAAPPTPHEDVVAPTSRRSSRFRLALGLSVLCGVACVSIGALFVVRSTKPAKPDTHSLVSTLQNAAAIQVDVQALRPSMLLNGRSTATIYLVPRQQTATSETATSSLEFDAILTQRGETHTEEYVLLNGHGYWSILANDDDATQLSAGCLQPTQVPPMSLLQPSLTSSRIVGNVIVGDTAVDMSCDDGYLLEVAFAGEIFAWCASSTTSQLVHAKGSDLTLTLTYLSDLADVPTIQAPHLDEMCPTLDTTMPLAVAPQARATRAEATAQLESATCGCQGDMKPCLFLHGVGESSTQASTSTFAASWGSIENNSPCCSSLTFAHLDTVSRPWYDATLLQEFCDAALGAASNNNGNAVGDLILVTHSMGNLIAGGAVANNLCQLSNRVSWVSLAGPMTGSKTANLLEQKCNSGGWGNAAIKSILSLVGKCPAQPAYLSLKTQDTDNSYAQSQFAMAQTARQQHTTKKLLCGSSPTGLITVDSALQIVSQMSGFDNPNDGVVDLNSCTAGVGTNGFGNTYSSSNYYASVNHLDASFRNGDGWWGDDRKPVKWFECGL
ncbi:Aste57867_3479 [Aphanomyces stellatus]|uniref:Aste57867_3479 protein n=1 Tax=Aphanomyces stellatus TaxID=120398 RepID=A0A485KC74_9STRA|nr:hypothetical protein As57867_003469 [Aphanomyces stellatus]VFT80644.1 Aste57867_3479 [Aphanomyces stellatus]